MSNLIKSNYIYFNQLEKKIIDSDSRAEKFMPMNFQTGQVMTEETPHEFVEGINIIHLDERKESEEELDKKKQEIIEEANKKASQIIEEAKRTAEMQKQSVLEEARSLGYTEGYQSAVLEVESMKEELDNKLLVYQEEYANKLEEIEPFFAELLVNYLEKITGIMEEDHKEIIYYLLHQAVLGIPGGNEYTIKVSKDDYAYVEKEIHNLEASFKSEVDINLLEDSTLTKNQCFIETNTRTIDCSLKVQMKNLITDIKLLAKI